MACYDLQAVLPAPRGDLSVFYYKSKLNSYNFTVSQLQKNEDVYCYFWHEGEGNRGATEIDSCVFKYLQQLSITAKDAIEVVFYSDNCGGQQKNKFTIAMYMHAVSTLNNIKSITHKFLIAGHTQNEGDNIHSLIEKEVKRSLKSGPIYVPYQYVSTIRGAKKQGKPYKVVELTHEDFYDFKDACQHYGNNYSITDDKQQIKFGDIKIIKVEKETPGAFFIKTSYEQNEYAKIVPNNKKRQSQQVRMWNLKKAYSKALTIQDRKKSDIMSLINAHHIPAAYKDFYTTVFNH